MLDVGCGTGRSRQIYRLKRLNYTGLDLSGNAKELARVKYPADEWICADACNLPFEEKTFDLVAFSSVLHHIPDFRPPLVEAQRVASARRLRLRLSIRICCIRRWPCFAIRKVPCTGRKASVRTNGHFCPTRWPGLSRGETLRYPATLPSRDSLPRRGAKTDERLSENLQLRRSPPGFKRSGAMVRNVRPDSGQKTCRDGPSITILTFHSE